MSVDITPTDPGLCKKHSVVQSRDGSVVIVGMWDGQGPFGEEAVRGMGQMFFTHFTRVVERSREWETSTWVCELSRFFDMAQERLFASKHKTMRSGCTALIAAIVICPLAKEAVLHVANAGDVELAYFATSSRPTFLSERHDATNQLEANRLLSISGGRRANTRGPFQAFYATQVSRDSTERIRVSSGIPMYTLNSRGDIEITLPPPNSIRGSFDCYTTYLSHSTNAQGRDSRPYKLSVSRAIGHFEATDGVSAYSKSGLIHSPRTAYYTVSLSRGPSALILGNNHFWRPFRRTCLSKYFCPSKEKERNNHLKTHDMLLNLSSRLSSILRPDGGGTYKGRLCYIPLPVFL